VCKPPQVPPNRLELARDSSTSWLTTSDGVRLALEEIGDGQSILLLHGLTATRRYVVHGSRALDRAGHRVIAYDARGHGESDPAPAVDAYDYERMIQDAVEVLTGLGAAPAVVVGQSMGAASAAGLAIRHPELVSSLVAVTPAHRGEPSTNLARWDRLAGGLEHGGPDGFLQALGPLSLPERYESAVETVIRQRVGRHVDPSATADALRATPRTAAFAGLSELEAISAPTLVVGSRDEADPDHPLEIARAWAERIPGARLVVEDAGESPLAWRGGALSAAILELLDSR
jgi:pimeloyl-ACP methyl ester carboxylesterase